MDFVDYRPISIICTKRQVLWRTCVYLAAPHICTWIFNLYVFLPVVYKTVMQMKILRLCPPFPPASMANLLEQFYHLLALLALEPFCLATIWGMLSWI